MRLRQVPVALGALALLLLACAHPRPAGFLYARSSPRDQVDFCADCLAYVRAVDAMFRRNGRAGNNRQFFKYALDTSCRGQLLLRGHCPKYRRSLLADPGRHLSLLDNPFETCTAIRAC
ncbi:hypothetical protein BO70DRAFT_380344 [Aspergillus heteromorphus CBS 117.55]|uniref:Saposin B-type domain-containing protein n=1 Tax=Aspergillus heteromorphus CBS 117.55 TaxID=1448321 RepID=A0A317VZT2_9EURO|nr:uncharacterized protein BO70DRAFT_380344 [Aspergillus heteromorphus CBS 117.55]PWY79159.1 hypothetical protein BO70DRAFT_380344 [Aspergillus heteromorphus CBS 117.55]